MSWKDRAEKVSSWKARAQPASDLPEGTLPDSPLAKALAAQSGDVVTVETPGGPGRFNRQGAPVLSDEEMQAEFANMGRKGNVELGKVALSGLGGASLGIAPAMAGASEANRALLSGDFAGILDAYRRGHKNAEAPIAEAESAYPAAKIGGEILTTLPIGAAATVAPRIAGGAMLAGGANAMRAPGDITQPGVPTATAEAGASAAMRALPFLGAGEAVGAGLQGVANLSRAGEEAATRAGKLQELLKRRKEMFSQLGSVRKINQSQQHTINELEEQAANTMGLYSPKIQAAAIAKLREPESLAIRERAAKYIQESPGRLLRAEDAARKTLADLKANATPAAADAAFAARKESAFGDQLSKFGKSIGQRAVLGTAADLVGTPAQAVGATAPGTIAALRNANKNFANRAAIAGNIGEGFEMATAATRAAEQGFAQESPLAWEKSASYFPKKDDKAPMSVAVEHSDNAMNSLYRYLGRPPKNRQKGAEEHFILGQVDPSYQQNE